MYSKTCVKRPLPKGQKIGFQDQLSLNAGQKYCRMLQLSTFIKLPFVIKNFVLSIFEWPFYTGFTVSPMVDVLLFNAVILLLVYCSSLLLPFCVPGSSLLGPDFVTKFFVSFLVFKSTRWGRRADCFNDYCILVSSVSPLQCFLVIFTSFY